MARTASTITIGQVEAIAVKLRDLPAADNKERPITKQETVRILYKEIKDLQKRGYTLQQVVELLKTDGVDIGPASLRSYLQRAGTIKRGKQQKNPEKADTPRPASTATVTEETASSFSVKNDTESI